MRYAPELVLNLFKDAARLHVDAYITGDVKYHEAQMAKELGLLVVDAGHFGTESIVADGLRDYFNRNRSFYSCSSFHRAK